MVDGGWTDAHSIWYVLTEQRCEHSVSEERCVADCVDPLWVHYHGYHLRACVCVCVCEREREEGERSQE